MKITKAPEGPGGTKKVIVQTKPNKASMSMGFKWWKAKTQDDLNDELLATMSFLKMQQQYRYGQASRYAKLYGNLPLYNVAGSTFTQLNTNNRLPPDRPTMNVVQSCIDTLISRISQSRPRPVFLTDNSDYKQRKLAKEMNNFANGELYQTKAYELSPLVLRDAAILGTGILKIYENDEKKIALERVLFTELFVDPNEAMYGDPRQLYQIKLMDREMVLSLFPERRSKVELAEQAYPDQSSEATRTVSDQIMVVEGWHLPSSKDAKDGKHAIACSAGLLHVDDYDKNYFPFEFMHYSPRLLGYWSQGLAEQLMGTQMEINKLLITISQSINLVGVPRVFVEKGSKVAGSHLDNQIGAIVKYEGTKPIYEVAPCVPAEVYAQLQRLIEFAYQQSGVSALAATSQKPAGLNSGEAIRNYDDLQSDRFATLQKRYENFFISMTYKIIDMAKDIANREGSYETVYPNKNASKQIKLPDAKLLEDPFVIQCFDTSSLPRDPSGRLEKVTEMAQAGMISMPEARRLLDYPDLEQVEKLANAGEERILQVLDEIVEEGKFNDIPDGFMDLQKAKELVTQYYNLYLPLKLEESRAELLRDFSKKIDDLMAEAAQAAQPQAQPQGVPMPAPQSPLLPNAPQQ